MRAPTALLLGFLLLGPANARSNEGRNIRASSLRLREATIDSNRPDLVDSLIDDVINESLLDCATVAVTSSSPAPPHSLDLVLQRVLGRAQRPWLVFRHEDLAASSPPSPNTLNRPMKGGRGVVCIAYLLLMTLKEAARTFRQLSRSDWYPGASRYFMWYGGVQVTPDLINNDPVLHDGYNTLYITPMENSNNFKLFANCPFCRAGEPAVVHRNSWHPSEGLLSPEPLFPDLFRDCNGHAFRSVSLEFSPFMVYTKEDSKSIGPVTKKDCLDVRIMDSIASTYNFTFNVYEPVDGKWGYQLPNGSWTGVIGTVERYEADTSMDVLITADRDNYVDFTIGYHTEPLTFVTSKPRPMPQWLSLVRPFQRDVWASLLVVVLLSGTVFWGFSAASKRIQQRDIDQTDNRTGVVLERGLREVRGLDGGQREMKGMTIVMAYFMMIGSLVAQGQRWPRQHVIMAFSTFWVIFTLVTTISYVSTLTAFLTVPALSPTLDSLEDLVKSDLSWGIADYGAADYQLFKSSKVPLYQRVFRGLEFCPSLIECIRQTQHSHFAYISWRTYMRDAIASEFTDRHGDSNTHMARENFFPGEFGFALQKGSPLKHPFDRVIRRLLEVGFVSKWLSDFIEEHKKEGRRMAIKAAEKEGSVTEDEESKSLSLHHLQGIFMVYAICLIISPLVFVAEVLTHRIMAKA